MATQHSSLRKGRLWILRRPQSKFVYNLSSKTVTGRCGGEKITLPALCLVKSSRKLCRLFWAMERNVPKFFQQISENKRIYIFSHIIESQVHHQYKYTIFYAIAKWKVCIMCMFGVILCTFWYTLYYQLVTWKCWSISA